MTSEEEAVQDAKTRLHDLEHAVAEAQAAVDTAPNDHDARGKRDMTAVIRDAGQSALTRAEAALAAVGPKDR